MAYTRRKKGTIRKRKNVPRNKKLNQIKSYHYSRFADKDNLSLSSQSLSTGLGVNFQFDNIVQYTDFTTLYDQYKITGVCAFIRLMTNPDSTVGSTQIFPTLWWITDYDDDTTPTLTTIKEKQGCKRAVLLPGRQLKVYVKNPHVDAMIYNGQASTGYATVRNQWVDCNSAAVPHYGLKMCVDTEGVINAGNYYISIEYKYYFSCRGAQ